MLGFYTKRTQECQACVCGRWVRSQALGRCMPSYCHWPHLCGEGLCSTQAQSISAAELSQLRLSSCVSPHRHLPGPGLQILRSEP